MRRDFLVGGFVIAVACSSLGYAAWTRASQSRATAPPGPSRAEYLAEASRVREELASLQARYLALALARKEGPREAEPAREARPAAADENVESTSEKSDQVPSNDERARHIAELEQRFETEPVDPRWGARRELDAKMVEALPRAAHVRSLDCRTTMCRLETSHVDAASVQEFTSRFSLTSGRDPLWAGAVLFQASPDPSGANGEVITVALLSRDSFPSASNE